MSDYHGYGEVVKEYKTLKPNKKMCGGCNCDEYNYGLGGAKGCLSFKDAKVVSKLAYHSIYSTGKSKINKTLSCYHGRNH